MRALFMLSLLIVSPYIQADTVCKVTEKSLLGGWVRDGEDGFFEEMAFSVEGKSNAFNSWLHHRPEIVAASWTLKGCTLTIKPTSDMPEFTYTVINVSKNSLGLRASDDNLAGYYKRSNTP